MTNRNRLRYLERLPHEDGNDLPSADGRLPVPQRDAQLATRADWRLWRYDGAELLKVQRHLKWSVARGHVLKMLVQLPCHAFRVQRHASVTRISHAKPLTFSLAQADIAETSNQPRCI
jgi:hypothetical protein